MFCNLPSQRSDLIVFCSWRGFFVEGGLFWKFPLDFPFFRVQPQHSLPNPNPTIKYHKTMNKNTLPKPKLPTLAKIAQLVKSLKKDIAPDCLAFVDDEQPGIQLTVGADGSGNWRAQTGDNSFTGGAYGLPHWGVVGVYRRSNSRERARDIIDQIEEQWYSSRE